MKYKLRKPINPTYNAIEQVLTNRGVAETDIYHLLNTTDEDINDFMLLGGDALTRAAKTLISTVQQDKSVLVIVDSDCDGFTSASLLLNYLHDLFPSWVNNRVDWFIHSGKQHGLSDVDVETTAAKYKLVICPDASSADYEYHLAFIRKNVDVLVLDHHEAKVVSPNAIVINNQLCDYPNKYLSGVGVTWQFCRYLDSLLGTSYAENYLDLVALGLTADMMSLQSFETKHLILKGFKSENLHNPFIVHMAERNAYSLGETITPMGAAFYLAPFVNAMVRSGEADEKELLFKSMLKFKAFELIPSTKRGHAKGEMAQLVSEAVRITANVKARQTKIQDSTMEKLESLIEEQEMMKHKVLLFLLEPGEVDKNVAGLIANKIMAKYMRPCAILTRGDLDSRPTYSGSARGCDLAGVTEFKDLCEKTGFTCLTAGHQGAFGLGIRVENLDNFIAATDAALKDMPDEPVYLVDYIYSGRNIDEQQLINIASLESIYGKDIEESYVAVDSLRVRADMVNVYVKKNNTLRIVTESGVVSLLFDAPDELCHKLSNTKGYVEMNIVGKPSRNEFNGNISGQIKIKDYEIVDEVKYVF